LLGRAYSISGRVVHGDKLGRTLGFATANVQLKHNRPPLAGIFAVRVHGVAERRCHGVASLGVRPTVKTGGRPTLEVHLFEYSGDLYRRHLHVEFIEKIRDEETYPDLAALKAQIARDCDAARAVLAAME
jgi:riboflavin kinase/FMN adenylyltransferase